MLACWLVGLLVGRLMQRAVDEHIEQYKQANPIVDDYAENSGQQEADIRDDAAGRAQSGSTRTAA